MIDNYSQITELFVQLDGLMKERTSVYMIGGGALMKWKMKPRTKDIDIVVSSVNEFDRLQNAFIETGFKPNLPTKEYERLAISQILVKEKFRVDLFCNKVCGRFSLSKGMKERSIREGLRTMSIELFVCSPEDILLFKTMTDREGDYDDCTSIIKNKADFDWSIVLSEAKDQSKIGQAVWITWITSRLEEFANRDMEVPIMSEMIRLAEDHIAEWERGLLERNPDKAI